MFVVEKLFSLLAPHECLHCGREGSLLCEVCRATVIAPLPPRCYRCHRLTEDSRVCEACRPRTRLRHVWIASEYDDLVKRLIYKFKFERAKDGAYVLAEMLHETAPYFPEDMLISYIPTATSRVRQRGYDQAAELAAAFARKRKLKLLPLLYREGQARQVGMGRTERRKQLETAFRPRNAASIKGASIVLIDDIVTTGATLEAASHILKLSGAKAVYGLAIAQKK